jgi:hypothetical protein
MQHVDRVIHGIAETIGRLAEVFANGGSRDLRSRAAVELGDLCWTRYWLVRHDGDIDVQRCLVEVQGLLARIGPLLTAPPHANDLTDARLIAGLTYLERYELTGDPGNLDRGIDLLSAASIFDLPARDPRRCQAGSELVEALRQLSILDGCSSLPADRGRGAEALDRAVTAAWRTLEAATPADGTAWFLLHRYTASAAYNRWYETGDQEDLELAYRCWQPLLPQGLDPASEREYRALLEDRDDLRRGGR